MQLKQFSKHSLVWSESPYCSWQQLLTTLFGVKTMTVILHSLLLHTQRLGEMVTLFLFNPRVPCLDFLCLFLLLCSFLL